MKGKLFLIQWNEQAAAKRCEMLERAGWPVEYESHSSDNAFRFIQSWQPNLILIDLEENTNDGIDVGKKIFSVKALRHIPLIFIGGKEKEIKKLSDFFYSAIFTTSKELNSVLSRFDEPQMY